MGLRFNYEAGRKVIEQFRKDELSCHSIFQLFKSTEFVDAERVILEDRDICEAFGISYSKPHGVEVVLVAAYGTIKE